MLCVWAEADTKSLTSMEILCTTKNVNTVKEKDMSYFQSSATNRKPEFNYSEIELRLNSSIGKLNSRTKGLIETVARAACSEANPKWRGSVSVYQDHGSQVRVFVTHTTDEDYCEKVGIEDDTPNKTKLEGGPQ